MDEQHLAIADADKIHDYVFSPHELKLIRGGSVLQTRLCKRSLKNTVKQCGGEPISANGGTVLGVFPNLKSAYQFRRSAQVLFANQTDVATVSTATAPYPPGKFGAAREQLLNALERVKQAREEPVFNGGNPFWLVCQACGLHPAAELRREPDNEWLCAACWMRRNAQEKREKNWEKLLARKPPQHFEAMGRMAKPENYLALVYIDLDRLGRYIDHRVRDSEDHLPYKRLALEIDSSVRRSVLRACRRFPEIGGHAPYETLLVGGDDAIVMLAAQHAFPFLIGFHRHFAQFLAQYPELQRLTFSAGIVIAHSHFPISEFMRIADDLLKSAKRIARQDDRKPDSVDFEILSTSMTDRVTEQREALRKRGDGFHRTGKPYPLKDLADLIDAVHTLKAGGRAERVKSLYQIIYQGKAQAELDYLFLLSRIEEEAKRTLLRVVGPELWRDRIGGGVETRAADVAEIWEFIHGSSTDNSI